MPRLLIPTIGSRLTLTEDWSFPLHRERRNNKMWEWLLDGRAELHPYYRYSYPTPDKAQEVNPFADIPEVERVFSHKGYQDVDLYNYVYNVTLPAGTILTVDRIYLKKGIGDYDSITFRISHYPPDKKVKKRFWVKLKDANAIVGEWDMSTMKTRENPNAGRD